MLSDAERQRTKDRFGADDAQVERDYLISHVLTAISDELGDRVRFYGGTALARTHVPNGRLSEDIDLIAEGARADVAEHLTRVLTRRLAREFGRPSFTPAIALARAAQPVTVAFPSGHRVQMQLLPSDHYGPWPFERRELVQRYADAAPATLFVPTVAAFVAWKTVTLIDRRAPRDLWDLAALASLGAFSAAAAELFLALGPFRSLPSNSTIPMSPSEDVWERDLAHQTRLRITAAQARATVVRAWASLR